LPPGFATVEKGEGKKEGVGGGRRRTRRVWCCSLAQKKRKSDRQDRIEKGKRSLDTVEEIIYLPFVWM
jgi:hypothetical protein